MKGLIKSRKALSPVVAAIILIAVTVAVSIAVAAWMGALTFTFMQTEELVYTGYTWDSAPAGWIAITVKNTGSADMTTSEVRVNDATATLTGQQPGSLAAGASHTYNVTRSFTPGVKYEFTVVTAKGNSFGPYIKTAP